MTAQLAPGSLVLFSQGGARTPIESIAAGSSSGQNEQSGLNLALFSHTSAPYALTALAYDPSAEMGITDGSGATVLGLSANAPGGTVAESSADGSQVGAVINSADLTQGGTVPDGPMALLTQWQAPTPVAAFATAGVTGIEAQLDLSVPGFGSPGGPGAETSSSQIVLYVGLTDVASGRQIAYGLELFDSRGVPAPYFGADTGPGGTGAAIVEMSAGASSRYDTAVAGAAGFQGASWNGAKHFAFDISAQNLGNAISYENAIAAPGTTALSTSLSNYVLTNVSVDSEIEYFGTSNSLSYSVSGLTVSETTGAATPVATTTTVVATAVAATAAVGTAVVSIPAAASVTPAASLSGAAGGWVATTAGSATVVQLGQGSETVSSMGAGDTITAGSGPDVVYGTGSGLSVTGGSGSLLFLGGTGSATVSGGSGSATLFGGTGGGSLAAGTAGGSILVAGSGNTTLAGAGQGDVLFGAMGDGSMLRAGQGAELLVAGGGAATLAGGSGIAVMFTGRGADQIVVGGGGTDEVVGFRANADHLVLAGGVSTVSAASGGWGTTLGLSDGTTVVMFGVNHVAMG